MGTLSHGISFRIGFYIALLIQSLDLFAQLIGRLKALYRTRYPLP